LEGDVAPVGNEDYKVTINDWVQEGLYVAGLQTNTNAAEFQRADCAPRDTLGDGLITVADWVQVGRYYLGLDPPTAQGGPTSPSAENGNIKTMRPEGGKMTPNSSTPRTITITPVTQGAITDTVSVQLAAQGNESALQFSVTFDPTALKYVSASAGNGASGGYLIVNTANVAAGQLGVVLSAGLGQTFAAGTQQIVTLKFNSVSYSNTTTSLAFTNAPVICQVVDANTGALSASYQNASLQVAATSWPLLAISQSAGNITLSWPSAPTVMNAQWSTNLGTNWTSAGGAPVTNAGTVLLTLPVPTNTTFFRLYGQ
jgi:hypothetical protein